MDIGETARKLSAITDAGVFERLATAILREANSQYRLLLHPGVNADGKTIKALLDGIAFVPTADPPQMVAVHHTTCKRDDLEEKWLHDPATVKPRNKGSKPTAGPGDLTKTIQIVQEQRKATPNLRATLILTTNEEPSESVVRKANAVAHAAGITVEIWSRSLLSHFLDFDPKGQWIRREFLRIEQERLSGELLHELSRRSIEANAPPGSKELWVSRELDDLLARLGGRDVVFLVADSGMGKSVACYKRLAAHVEAGGYGLVLPHEVLANSQSLDQAIDLALRQLHPGLVPGAGSEARALASESASLLIVVEDVNKSGQPAVLLEKLAGWSSGKDGSRTANCQLLCPVWPRILASLGDEARKRLDALAIAATSFTAEEGTAAVQRRREESGLSGTLLESIGVSKALGHDPLLIALHDPAEEPKPEEIIERFIGSSLARLAHARGEFTASQYRQAIRQLAAAMLERRCVNLSAIIVAGWFTGTPETAKMLTQIALFGELLRTTGSASDERIEFRHDRVRDWLLTDAAVDLMRRGTLSDAVLAEPYFAEAIGAALLRPGIPIALIEQTRRMNPLALFCALRLFGNPINEVHRAILAAIESWLREPATHARDNLALRWEAGRILSECESTDIIRLARLFNDRGGFWTRRARFRNGDILAGIELCMRDEPGVSISGHLELIAYVRAQHSRALIQGLDEHLRANETNPDLRAGALRLAGNVADPVLAPAIEASWQLDSGRGKRLADYLWACARCGGEDPARLLDPVCTAWAALPAEREENRWELTRHSLAAHGLRWAFRYQGLPEPVLHYFLEKTAVPELQWPITYMLHCYDHPDAVEFIARELAAQQKQVEGTDRFSPFSMTAKHDWEREQEHGHPMSAASRSRLHDLWKDEGNDKHLRKESFRLWASTILSGDLAVLRNASQPDLLADSVLWQRLHRGDREAIPAMMSKLRETSNGYWWQLGRTIWSEELTGVLDEELTRRGARVKREWNSSEGTGSDWAISGILMRLPIPKVEQLLLKHWDHLQFSSEFVQTALYVATPLLVGKSAAAIAECADPKELLAHLATHFGHKTVGHPGITRRNQVESVIPYLDHLSDHDIDRLWDTCNDHGWFDLRRQHLDHRIKRDNDKMYTDDSLAMAALDKMLTENRTIWIDHWVDEFLKTGVSIDSIMELVRTWLARQTKITALDLAANLVIHAGHRNHLSILAGHEIEPADQASSIIANAAFAVSRRSIS